MAAQQAETLHDFAVRYANYGFLIFPVSPADKAPLNPHGMNEGTTNLATIADWWARWPDALIGCRIPEDVVVLDIDPRHGGDTTWQALTDSYGPVDTGRKHHSGRGDGGFHAWFKKPAGKLSIKPLHEWARKQGTGHSAGKNSWASGIDLLHHNHRYTILPPSPHPVTSQPYVWDSKAEPAPLPGWLTQYVTATPTTPPPNAPLRIADENSIADWYSANHSWNDILGTVGWVRVHGDGDGDGSSWRHPNATSAQSCTIKHGCLFVYTPNTDFDETEQGDPKGYTRFRAWAILEHGNNLTAAARAALEARDGPATVYPNATPFDPADPWPEPTPLTTHTELPPFPIHVLPAWMAAQCEAVSGNLQVAGDLACILGLGAVAVATIGHLKVSYPRQAWIQPCNIYAVVALDASSGKSPVKSMMFKPLEEYELERIAAARKERQHHQSDIDIRTAQVATYKKVLAKEDDAFTRQMLADTIDTVTDLEATMPPSGRLIADDATIEALGIVLADAGGAIGVVSAEGGLFDRLAGLYSDNGINLDLYLEGWSGGRYTLDRVKRDPISVPSANVSVITTVQPFTLDQIGAKQVFNARGLVARFLMCKPASNVGHRDRKRTSINHQAEADRYALHIERIARDHADDPVTLTVDGPAGERFAEWDQATENRLNTDLAHLKEWVGKLRANTLRLAAILHVAHGRTGDLIDVGTVDEAIELADYFTAHALGIAAEWGAGSEAAQAKQILEWIAHGDIPEFSVRDLYGANRRQFPSADDCIPPLSVLVEAGFIRPLFEGPISIGRGGKPSPRFVTHPSARSARSARGVGVCASAREGRNLSTSLPLSDSVPTPEGARTARTEHTTNSEHTTTMPHTVTDPGDLPF